MAIIVINMMIIYMIYGIPHSKMGLMGRGDREFKEYERNMGFWILS